MAEQCDIEELKEDCPDDICRICYTGASSEALLAPCNCKGSHAKVHRTCLETWLGYQARHRCEICKHVYTTIREPKGFQEWLLSTMRDDAHRLIADILGFLMMTWLTVFWRFYLESASNALHWKPAKFPFLTILIFLAYGVWVAVVCFDYYSIWIKWRTQNFKVNLILNTDKSSCRCCALHRDQATKFPENEMEAGAVTDAQVIVEQRKVRKCISEPSVAIRRERSSPIKSSSSTLIIRN